MLGTYMEKTFKSVSDADLNIVSDEEKRAAERAQEEHKDILAALKEALAEKVKDVRLSDRLKSSPVCLTSDGPLTIEMEKVLSSMPVSDGSIKAERCWSNPAHPVFRCSPRWKQATSASKSMRTCSTIRRCSSKDCPSRIRLRFPTPSAS